MLLNLGLLSRKKKYTSSNLEHSNLSRVLNLLDLSALGVSSTLGSGVYVLIGNITANYAGPSIIISFILAGICSLLAGMCYAEIGARVPRSGSAYSYIYVTIGEFAAFIIGWDIILEYMIGTSSAASVLSKYVDVLADHQISKSLQAAMPMHSAIFAPYPDFLAFGFALVVIGFLVVGVKESSVVNIVFTGFNLIVIAFIIFCGALRADVSNWNFDPRSNFTWTDTNGMNMTCTSTNRCGKGGFAPFGFAGIIKGAAKCFYAYIGFDCISSTGEETLNPKRNIPLSIIITLGIVSVCYIGISAVLTLMIPYFIIDFDTPMPSAFNYVHLGWVSHIVTIGALISIATCLYSGVFPLPRVVYSMASDGLIFRFLAYLMPRLKTPVVASAVTGLFSGILALLFDLDQLVDMLSIGTLLAYSIVSACTLILRYRPFEVERTPDQNQNQNDARTVTSSVIHQNLIGRMFFPASLVCTRATSRIVDVIVLASMFDICIICFILNYGDFSATPAIVFLIFFIIVLLVLTYIIWVQPENKEITTFKVPLVPFFPMLSAFFNIYLMFNLNLSTWIRLIIWFVVGMFIYFGYGIRNSSENVQGSYQNVCFPCLQKPYATMEEDSHEMSDTATVYTRTGY